MTEEWAPARTRFALTRPIRLHALDVGRPFAARLGGVEIRVNFVRAGQPEEKKELGPPSDNAPIGWQRGTTILTRDHKPDVVVVDGCDISFWLNSEQPHPTIDTMDRALMAWLRVFDRWADLFRAVYQPAPTYVGRPLVVARFKSDETWREVRASGAMSINMNLDEPYEGLELHILEYTLARASAGEDVPTSWRLIRNADRAAEGRDARLMCIEAGAAAETALSELLRGMFVNDSRNLAAIETKTLGGKLHAYAKQGGAMPESTDLDTHLEGLLGPRNDATHGRAVTRDQAEECVRLARLWAHEANPLPVYEGPSLEEEAVSDRTAEDLDGYGWHRLARRLVNEGKATATLAMAEALSHAHGDAALWLCEQAIRGVVEGAEEALPDWLTGVIHQASIDLDTVGYAYHLRGFTRRSWSISRSADWHRAVAYGNEGARESLRTLPMWQRAAGLLIAGIIRRDPYDRTPSWGWHGPDIEELSVPEDGDRWLWNSAEWTQQ